MMFYIYMYGLKFDQTSLEKINCFKVKFVRTYLYFPYGRAQDFVESRWDGRVVRWCRVKLPVPGVLLIWMTVGHWPTTLAVGAGGGRLLFRRFSSLLSSSHSLGDGPI